MCLSVSRCMPACRHPHALLALAAWQRLSSRHPGLRRARHSTPKLMMSHVTPSSTSRAISCFTSLHISKANPLVREDSTASASSGVLSKPSLHQGMKSMQSSGSGTLEGSTALPKGAPLHLCMGPGVPHMTCVRAQSGGCTHRTCLLHAVQVRWLLRCQSATA